MCCLHHFPPFFPIFYSLKSEKISFSFSFILMIYTLNVVSLHEDIFELHQLIFMVFLNL